MNKNLKLAYGVSLGWALMYGAGCDSTINLFASHHRVPRFIFGFLSGLPLLLAPLFQAWSTNVLDRTGARKSIASLPVLFQAACFIPLAFLPFFPQSLSVSLWLLVLAVLNLVYGQTAHPSWYSRFADLIPERGRGRYMAFVQRGVGMITQSAVLCLGGALWWANTFHPGFIPWIFSAAFFIAGMARFASYLVMIRIQDVPYRPESESSFTFWQFIRRTRESNFVHFVLFVGIFSFCCYTSGPFYLPYITYDLGYSESAYAFLATTSTVASILALPFLGRFVDRHGNKRMIQLSAYGITLTPLFAIFARGPISLGALFFFSGIVWAGFGLASGNYILDAVSPPKRARCVSYYSIISGVFVFLGSMTGTWLSSWIPRHIPLDGHEYPFQHHFIFLLIVSFSLRAATTLVFLPTFREVRTVQTFSPRIHLLMTFQTIISSGERWIPFLPRRKPPSKPSA